MSKKIFLLTTIGLVFFGGLLAVSVRIGSPQSVWHTLHERTHMIQQSEPPGGEISAPQRDEPMSRPLPNSWRLSSSSSSPIAAMKRLENPRVGYSLWYPQDWQVRGQVVATDFARSAPCESVEVVDFQPPSESGPSAVILHSFVQICAKPLANGATLEEFLRQTYGEALTAHFQSTDLHGIHAYQAHNEIGSTTIFLQTNEYRLQIVSAVVADAAKRSKRHAEVEAILESFSIVQQ